MKTLNEFIKEYENSDQTEKIQISKYLKDLDKYIKKDTPMRVQNTTLSGRDICPNCNGLMKLGVRHYCDICGQAIKWAE